MTIAGYPAESLPSYAAATIGLLSHPAAAKRRYGGTA